MAAQFRLTDVLGGVVGGLEPLVPFLGWRTYGVDTTYVDPEGVELPAFRMVKLSGPDADTVSQIQARTASYLIEKQWPMGAGVLSGQYPGLAWYLMDPTTMALMAGPLTPIDNVPVNNLSQATRDIMPLSSHVLQWYSHSVPIVGPYIGVLVAREPTSEFPLFVGGHPVDIATALLTRKGEAYDAVTAAAVRASVGPELAHLAPITSPDERPQDVIDLFSKAYGFAVRRGESGSAEFVHWREKISTLPTPVLDDNSIRAEGGPTFDLSEATRVTRVTVTGQTITQWTPGTRTVLDRVQFHLAGPPTITYKTVAATATDKPASGLLINSAEIAFPYSTDGTTADSLIYGEQTLDIDLGGMPAFIGSGGGLYQMNLEQFAEGIARKTFDGHARGRQIATAVGIRNTDFDDAKLGEAVTVTIPQVPSAQIGRTPTSQRILTSGDQRPFRVIERTEEPTGPVVVMADEGTGVQFATVPSLTVVLDATAADMLLVTVSDQATLAAAGAQVEFQVRVFATGDPIDVTDPGVSYTVKDSTLWTGDPLRLGPFPAGHTVLLRVRAWLYGGAASDWSPWTGLGGEITGPQTTLSDLVVNAVTDEGAVISWSYDESPQVGDVLVQYRLHGGGGYTLFSTLAPGTETETIDGLAADTWYDVKVVLDNGGEYGDVLLGTFQTLVGSISALVVGTPTSDGAPISWTNSHPTALVRVDYKLTAGSTYQLYQVLPAGSVQLTLTGLTAATGYDVRVQLIDPATGTDIGFALADSFTTAGGGSMVTLPTPTDPVGFGGVDPSTGANSPGTFGLDVTAVFGPPHMTIVFEVAVETSVGSGTPGSYTAQAPVPAVVGGVTRFTASAPNDNLLRFLKAKAVATGFTASAYTTAVAVNPWPTVPITGGNALLTPGVGVLRLFGWSPEIVIGTGAGSGTVIALPFIIDGGGAVITTGIKGDVEIPFAGTITGWTLLADLSGSITIDTWKDTYANFPPLVADTMWGTKPALSSQTKNQATGLSIAVTAGNIIRYNVDSAATVTRVLLSFQMTRA
jgi:hypothetical protein